MMTDAAADGGQGVLFLDEFEGFLIFAFGHKSHVALNGNVGGAGGLTRRGTLFLNGKGSGYRLGIAPVYGAALAQTQIKFIPAHNRTDSNAVATAGALVRINITRLLGDSYLKVSRLPGYFLYLC
jgi:hypothetical protein